MNYYRQAALHSEQAFALQPILPYKASELDAKLAQANLHEMLARDERVEASRACASYRAVGAEVALAQESVEAQEPEYARLLKKYAARAERGERACSAGHRIAAGAALLGFGAAGMGVALGLFADYTHACRFGVNQANGHHECLGIPASGDETERYTAQVRASAGLAIGGGAAFVTGTALLIPALVQRRYSRSRRFLFTPSLGIRRAGFSVQLRF